MFWITLTVLGLTIATCRFIQTRMVDGDRHLGIFVAAVFLSVGLANAPVLLKGLVLLWLLIEPNLSRYQSPS